jgi:hypothetical protein
MLQRLTLVLFVIGLGLPSSALAQARISGTVTVAPGLGELPKGAVVFIYARSRMDGAGPPVAVMRIQGPEFPLKFSLGPEHAPIPGRKIDGEMFLFVRTDLDGNATSKDPGDWLADPVRVQAGADDVQVTLTRARGAAVESGQVIQGTIELAEGLEVPKDAVLFLFAKSKPNAPGAPLAVRRFDVLSFPLTFVLGPKNMMQAGQSFEGKVYLHARIDADGRPMTREEADLVNEPTPAEVGGSQVTVRIDRHYSR